MQAGVLILKTIIGNSKTIAFGRTAYRVAA